MHTHKKNKAAVKWKGSEPSELYFPEGLKRRTPVQTQKGSQTDRNQSQIHTDNDWKMALWINGALMKMSVYFQSALPSVFGSGTMQNASITRLGLYLENRTEREASVYTLHGLDFKWIDPSGQIVQPYASRCGVMGFRIPRSYVMCLCHLPLYGR